MSERTTAQRSTIRLSVAMPDGRLENVEVTVSPDATVADLSTALARHVNVAPTGTLRSERAGAFDASARVRSIRLRDGDTVALSGDMPPGHTTLPIDPVAEFVVVGGPQAGRRAPLPAGSHVIGRDPSASIVIDDPSLSRHHLAVHIDRSGASAVSDEGSSNGTAIDGARLPTGERRRLTAVDQIEAGRSMFVVRPWRAADMTRVHPAGARIAFNRQPRVSRVFEPATLRVPTPPGKLRAQRIPLVAAVIPLVMGVAMFAITRSPYMIMMAAFTPIMMVGSTVTDRRSGRKEHEEQVKEFDAAVDGLDAALADARSSEVAERRAAAPDAGEIAARALRHLPELWERRPADGDFLDVRIGVGDQPTTTAVIVPDGGDPAQRGRVEELVAKHRVTPAVPVRVRLSEVGAVGLAGTAESTDACARWLVTQLAVLHSPRDLVIAAALGEDRVERWSWLGWLPHVSTATSPLDVPGVAVGESASRDLLREAARLAAERREEDGGRGRARRRTTLVLVVDDAVAPERVVIDELLNACSEVDIVAIWLAADRRSMPGGCGAIVELGTGRSVATITWTGSGQSIADASADGIPLSVADEIARALAPVTDVTSGGSATELPRSIALTAMLDLAEPSADDILLRWKRRARDGLPAVIGVTAGGEPLAVDLRADGPHALVAGTTGSGKSELLQTLVASLAATHPPDRLAFLLVDYKGGAAFKDCVELPHTAGMVTDLDEHEVHRALLSLNAELRRREHILSEAGVRDLMELERRDPAAAPPSLAIVIDEFATLAKEIPAFVDGVVDVAQRGRSLGVHLILATQRPGNAVTENVRANTNLRIALRVASAAESDDVIGAPDAARLPRSVSGRALVRTGPSELKPFQTAYVGGRTHVAREAAAVEILPLEFGVPVAPPRSAGTGDDETTDLELLVQAIGDATAQTGVTRPQSPWLPSLPAAVSPEDAARFGGEEPSGDDRLAIIGLVDEPRRQRRTTCSIDLAADGSLLIFGGPGAGKTTTLRTLAATLASHCSPDELNVYGLDFAGRGLAALESLPHCGSIVPGEDEQRVTRLIGMLRRTIDDRAQRFAASGALDLEGHRRARPDERLPRILVLLDSYAGFTDAYERIDLGALVDAVPRIVAEGRSAGVHFAITADRRTAVPTAVASVVPRKIVLRMASEDEYTILGLDVREVRGAVLSPGRGFLDDGREVQLAVVGGQEDGPVQAAALAELADNLQQRYPGTAASPITPMPADVPRAALPSPSTPLRAVLGVDELELAPVEISLEDMHFAVIGPYRSGRSTALGTLAMSVRDGTPDATLHLLATRRSPLAAYDCWASVAQGTDACEERIGELLDELVSQVPAGTAGGPTIVVIDDAGELAESSSQGALEQLLKRGRDANLRVVAGLETGQARHYAAWIRELRKDSHGILLDPNLDIDGDLLSVRLPRKTNPQYPAGRGYLVAAGTMQLVQVARG